MEEAEDKSILVVHQVETHNRSMSTGGESTHLSRCRGNRRTPGGLPGRDGAGTEFKHKG